MATILYTAIYTAMLTYMLTDYFTRKRYDERLEVLRGSTREQIGTLRDFYHSRETRTPPSPRSETSFSTVSLRFQVAADIGYLKGRVGGMSSNLDQLTRRITALEANTQRPRDGETPA